MPKVTITGAKGLVQESGNGFQVEQNSDVFGLTGHKWTASTSLVSGGANDVEMTLTQPAGTVLVDVGFILTTAIAMTSGNANFKVGTADDGAELVAATALVSSAAAAAIGSGISLSGLNSEGAAALAVVASAAMYTSAARTIYLRMENSTEVTAGAGKAWISYVAV